MTQPDILMLLDDMTDTQRAIVLLLAKKIQEKETRAKQLGVEESHQRLIFSRCSFLFTLYMQEINCIDENVSLRK